MRTSRLAVGLLAFAVLALSGCSESGAPTQPTVSRAPSSIEYVGSESLGQRLTEQEREALLEAFSAYHQPSGPSTQTTTSSEYTAYGWSWHYSGGTDLDMYLEYKWYSGGARQPYQIVTPIWGIYWIIHTKYGGHLVNWTWLEGSYQRATVLIGSALWAPYSTYQQSFLRSNIRIRTY